MPEESIRTTDNSFQKDFLLKHYSHLSELWKRRDEMRIAFLRFYFLFLGGIAAIIGFSTKGATSLPNFSDLIGIGIVKMFLVVSIVVGLLTFSLINYIRLHNLRCIDDMSEIAKWFDKYTANPLAERITSSHKTPVRGFRGIDFINSCTISLVDSIMAGVLFYEHIWISLIAFIIILSAHVGLWFVILQPQKTEAVHKEKERKS